MTDILYYDNQVTIYKDLIVIKKYYFPLATSKTIFFQDVHHCALLSTEEVDHKWGLCGKHLNNWFPYDSNRDCKKKFIEITLKGEKIRPSITPEDPDTVFGIIWQYHTKEGQQSMEEKHRQMVKNHSQYLGKENELARQQLRKREHEASKKGDISERSERILESKATRMVVNSGVREHEQTSSPLQPRKPVNA